MVNLKLTNHDMATYNATTWRLGDANPELAVVLNSIHANFSKPRLFCVETAGRQKHDALKSGAQKLRLVEELDVPTVSMAARIRFAIYVARAIPNHSSIPAWETWADKWLSGEDRSIDVAAAAAAWAAAARAARAARAAARAAEAEEARAAAAAAWAAAEIDFRQLLAQAIQDEPVFIGNS